MLRKSLAFLTVGLLVLAVNASSFGALVGTATLVKQPPGTPFSAPDAALSSPWVSYILSIKGNAGEVIQAAEANILGQLHQRWVDSDGDEVFEPTANSFAASGLTNGDSHLLAPNGALFGSGPTEDNPGTGSPLPSTASALYGVGTMLQGAFALTTATAPNGSLNVAYIVIPANSGPQFNITIKGADPTGADLGTLTAADFFQVVGNPPVVNPFSDLNPTVNKNVSTTITATNSPTSWGNLLNPTYTIGNGGKPGALGAFHQPTWNPATQAFAWDTTGSTGGTYTWQLIASNASGPSLPGLITVGVFVPEPATLSMFGLALVGLVGVARHRS